MTAPATESSFGKYRLLERIAVGGMAEIYRARYEAAAGVTRPVVIKKILPAFAGNRNFVAMFVNEARIAVGLSHGNIAQVFDFGEIDGEYFLAMEYVPGQTLSKVIRKARAAGMPVLPLPYACRVAVELCNGLHYAHTRVGEDGQPLGIIHRDVTPQNVLLSWEGQVKIVDFGIAKARHASGEKTETGAIKGKYLYFSPEQARGGRDLDARSDVYAAGIVLYEMLCGRRPFEGKMMEVLGDIIRGDFDRPRTVNANLPVELEEIVLRAMGTDRDARYQSAQELANALSALLRAQAPDVPASSLEHFMSFLYEKELVKEGRPARIPPEFVRELERWRNPRGAVEAPSRESSTGLRATPGAAPPPKAAAALPEKKRETLTELAPRAAGPAASEEDRTIPLSRLGAPPPEPPEAPPRWVFVAVPLAAALLAGFFVLLIGFRQASIRITSEPPGALVLVDGHPAPKVTPLEIRGLEPGEPHRIELRADGMQAWQRDVTPQPGETVTLDARLEPIVPSPAAP